MASSSQIQVFPRQFAKQLHGKPKIWEGQLDARQSRGNGRRRYLNLGGGATDMSPIGKLKAFKTICDSGSRLALTKSLRVPHFTEALGSSRVFKEVTVRAGNQLMKASKVKEDLPVISRGRSMSPNNDKVPSSKDSSSSLGTPRTKMCRCLNIS